MKTLKDILFGVSLKSIEGDREVSVEGIAFDSRKVGNNFLFVAVKGLTVDGHDFIAKYPNEDFSLMLLETTLLPSQDVDKIKESMALLEDVMNRNQANTTLGRKILTYIQQQEAVANVKVGKVAPDFSAPTPEGEMLALSDIKGKATIIDFWASWCGPCRRENPNVVRIYEKYHDKGLEIIGVSLDRENQKQRWIDAIDKDNLTWHQVSNLQYSSSP